MLTKRKDLKTRDRIRCDPETMKLENLISGRRERSILIEQSLCAKVVRRGHGRGLRLETQVCYPLLFTFLCCNMVCFFKDHENSKKSLFRSLAKVLVIIIWEVHGVLFCLWLKFDDIYRFHYRILKYQMPKKWSSSIPFSFIPNSTKIRSNIHIISSGFEWSTVAQ